mmetsp:Transcript_18051/g.50137  ORF Transcript_18051/g.50137 Transcript_18051/m.50137 type:complete len:262 (-) Transcript_18051:892-1677(-)
MTYPCHRTSETQQDVATASADDDTCFGEVLGGHLDLGRDARLHLGTDVGNLHLELAEGAVCLDILALVHLDVALGQGHHLWQNRGHSQVVELKPLRSGVVETLHLVCALFGLAVVADVRHEVVLSLRIRRLAIWVDVVPQIQAFQREGHNRRVLLDEEIVVAKPLDNKDHVRRNAPQAISSNLTGFAAFGDGLKGLLPIEFLKQVEQRNLGDEVEVVLEKRLVGELQGHENGLLLGFCDSRFVRRGAHLHLNLALEHVVDH